MCTAIALHGDRFFFGRNMDLDYDFGGGIVTVPRHFRFSFLQSDHHFAIMGMARVVDGFPLYADAMNEKGLCMAALNFPRSGYYFQEPEKGKRGIASFEMIPFVLSVCSTVEDALEVLKKTTVIQRGFRDDIPPTFLHWMVSDRHQSVSVEPLREGLRVDRNPLDVLTNEPPFSFHRENVCYYQCLSARTEGDTQDKSTPPTAVGAMGLPGDYSSVSRFIKANFLLQSTQNENVCCDAGHLFRILQAVAPPRGSVILPNGNPHYTVYSCCMDPLQGEYCYQSYGGIKTTSNSLFSCPLEDNSLIFTKV
jgi:choloylglycine hydrolase